MGGGSCASFGPISRANRAPTGSTPCDNAHCVPKAGSATHLTVSDDAGREDLVPHRLTFSSSTGKFTLPFRVPQTWLDGVFYLYPDGRSAEADELAGGCGFLLGWPIAEDSQDFLLFAVTNRHVVDQGSWTVRLNGKPSGLTCIETNDAEWIFAENSDLAIRPMALSQNQHRFNFITNTWLLDRAWYTALNIGPGDECLSIGRFVGHAGKNSNNPVVRFGQISQNPIEPVLMDGQPQECFLVESRSIGGYSGSPVFVHLDKEYYRDDINGRVAPDGTTLGRGRFPTGPFLLGVNCAMIKLWDRVCDASKQVLQTGFQVPMNTGMMAVVPAWHIIQLMEAPAVTALRREIEKGASVESVLKHGISPIRLTSS